MVGPDLTCPPAVPRRHADANFVLTGSGAIVEIQGTAEKEPFSEQQFLELLSLAKAGCAQLVDLQRAALASTS